MNASQLMAVEDKAVASVAAAYGQGQTHGAQACLYAQIEEARSREAMRGTHATILAEKTRLEAERAHYQGLIERDAALKQASISPNKVENKVKTTGNWTAAEDKKLIRCVKRFNSPGDFSLNKVVKAAVAAEMNRSEWAVEKRWRRAKKDECCDAKDDCCDDGPAPRRSARLKKTE